MNFAGVWRTPTIFLCQNNGVAQSTTIDKQTAASTLAVKADAYGFPGARVDGMDPFAVSVAVSEAAERARRGDGPTFIEMVTYRFSPHSTYDGLPAYRTREEEGLWRAKDPVTRTRMFLEAKGMWSADAEEQIRDYISATLERVVGELEARAPVGRDFSPTYLYDRVPALLADQLRTEADDLGLDPVEFDVWPVDDEPTTSGPTEEIDFTTALNRVLIDGFDRDDTLIALGEDVGLEGGVFRITEGMHDRFGADRVIDTPLCETGIVGTSVGMAMAGLRPVAEIEFAGFVYPAFDQVIGHMARIRWRYRGELTSPVVLRMPVGTDIDSYEFHCDTPEAFFAHVPGLVVVYPSTPYDAAGLMRTALESPDPVVFFEPIPLYRGFKQAVPIDPFRVPFGRARTIRSGTDVTVVVYGYATRAAVAAAEQLATEGVSVELIDLRTIYPWDVDTVVASVERTGRLVTVHEAPLTAGLGGEIVATVTERAAYSLESPPVRVGHADLFWGPTQLEVHSRISIERITAGVRRAMKG
jgi:2-oxoisovalerate dehydrogenase E1 component